MDDFRNYFLCRHLPQWMIHRDIQVFDFIPSLIYNALRFSGDAREIAVMVCDGNIILGKHYINLNIFASLYLTLKKREAKSDYIK